MYPFVSKSLSEPTYLASIHQPLLFATFLISLSLFLFAKGFASSRQHRVVTGAQYQYVFGYHPRTCRFKILVPPDSELYSLRYHYGSVNLPLNFSVGLWVSYDESQLHAVSRCIED